MADATKMFPNECLVARELEIFVIFRSNGTSFFMTVHLISSSNNSKTSTAWSVWTFCKTEKIFGESNRTSFKFPRVNIGSKVSGAQFRLRSKYPSLLLGHSTCSRLSESTRPHRETHDVGADELRETQWNQVNRIARHGPCRFCVRRLLCSS